MTFGMRLRKKAKLLAIAAVLGLSYGGHTIYEYRQPYEWSGTVEAKTVALGSRTGGRVKDVVVREGDTVRAGAVLVVLEAGDIEAQQAIADAELEAATAAHDKLANGARPEEVVQASARLAEARASVGKESGQAMQERKEFERTNTLFNGGAISAAERDSTAARMRAASGSVAGAAAREREAAAALKLIIGGTRPEDLRIAKAAVAAAGAKRTAIANQREELTIRAPRAGRVESITVRPGDILRPNAPAATLLENGQLYVRIYVPETLIGKLKIGQQVPVAVDSFPKRKFAGRVEHINEIGEFTPRRLTTTEERADEVFGARVALLEGESELRAGMAAFIQVPKK